MGLALTHDELSDRDVGSLAVAFVVALAVHVAALLALSFWRSGVEVSPPGEKLITIDLAPNMIEAPTIEAVETNQPAGIPAETVPVEPVEAIRQPAFPEIARAITPPPVEAVTPPPPPEADQVETAPAEARTIEPPPPAAAPPAIAESVLPLDVQPIESTAREALTLPPTFLPPPERKVPVGTARPVPQLKPRPKPKAVEREHAPKPERLKPTSARSPQHRERPKAVQQAARPGAAGQAVRETRGMTSRENTGGSAAAAADPTAMSRYAAQLATALKARLRYPEAARAAGVYGVTTLRFTLHRSGRILSSSVASSAGSPMLDQAALATAPAGGSLPPAPDGLPQQQFTISVPLRFSLR